MYTWTVRVAPEDRTGDAIAHLNERLGGGEVVARPMPGADPLIEVTLAVQDRDTWIQMVQGTLSEIGLQVFGS